MFCIHSEIQATTEGEVDSTGISTTARGAVAEAPAMAHFWTQWQSAASGWIGDSVLSPPRSSQLRSWMLMSLTARSPSALCSVSGTSLKLPTRHPAEPFPPFCSPHLFFRFSESMFVFNSDLISIDTVHEESLLWWFPYCFLNQKSTIMSLTLLK